MPQLSYTQEATANPNRVKDTKQHSETDGKYLMSTSMSLKIGISQSFANRYKDRTTRTAISGKEVEDVDYPLASTAIQPARNQFSILIFLI